MLEIDIFVYSTGIFNFSMKKFKNKAFVENTGHLDNELDWARSEGLEGVKVATASLPTVHGVIVLASILQVRATHCRRRNCTFLYLVRSSLFFLGNNNVYRCQG